MDLWITKMICLFLILLLTILFGLLPIRLVACLRRQKDDDFIYRRNTQGQNSRSKKILAYLNCFSGGVFMSTCFLHLFPEVLDKYAKVVESGRSIDFPLAELVIMCGFFLIMIIEHGVMSLSGPHFGHTHGNSSITNRQQGSGRHDGDRQGERDHILPNENQLAYGAIEDHLGHGEHVVVEDPPCSSLLNSYSSYHKCDNQPAHHHHPGQTHEETEQIHSIRAIVLLLALSFHTVFEGLALGLEMTQDNVWTLFAALAVHKSIIAFTLGLQLTDTFHQAARVAVYIVIFACIAPIGIATGTAITTINHESFAFTVSNMVLQGLATGTFLYVTFFEVLQKELSVEDHSFKKVIVVIFGFSAMALTNLLE